MAFARALTHRVSIPRCSHVVSVARLGLTAQRLAKANVDGHPLWPRNLAKADGGAQ